MLLETISTISDDAMVAWERAVAESPFEILTGDPQHEGKDGPSVEWYSLDSSSPNPRLSEVFRPYVAFDGRIVAIYVEECGEWFTRNPEEWDYLPVEERAIARIRSLFPE